MRRHCSPATFLTRGVGVPYIPTYIYIFIYIYVCTCTSFFPYEPIRGTLSKLIEDSG